AGAFTSTIAYTNGSGYSHATIALPADSYWWQLDYRKEGHDLAADSYYTAPVPFTVAPVAPAFPSPATNAQVDPGHLELTVTPGDARVGGIFVSRAPYARGAGSATAVES